ncbi:MAG TPA: hypothetical protein VNS19_11215 [Acidimicrobiales bacterium]|nr:hypothetical protein [Acidimicrobiales bacterium]
MSGPAERPADEECGGDPPCWEGRIDDHRDRVDGDRPLEGDEP